MEVYDPTELAHIPIGKQRLRPPRSPSGIFYTATSGIWQTVWLEPVRPSSSLSLCVGPCTAPHCAQHLCSSQPSAALSSAMAVQQDAVLMARCRPSCASYCRGSPGLDLCRCPAAGEYAGTRGAHHGRACAA